MFKLKPPEYCREIFEEYKWLTIPCIYMLKCFLFVRSNLASLMRCSDFHKYEARHKNIICVPQYTTSTYESSPRLAGIAFYNRLPDIFKVLNDSDFKNEIKKLFVEKKFLWYCWISACIFEIARHFIYIQYTSYYWHLHHSNVRKN